jgi:RloB-like protein
MSSRRLRDKPDLRRTKGTRKERVSVLIVTEGERTEVQYFKRLCHYLRATGVNVYSAEIKGTGRDPVHVVNTAKKESNSSPIDFNSIWFVFDVDDHARLDEAITKAQNQGFKLAVSNPCFEIWLLWHFEECQRHMSHAGIRARLRDFGITDKKIPDNFPFENARKAAERADPSVGRVPKNPGSGVRLLSEYLHAGCPTK